LSSEHDLKLINTLESLYTQVVDGEQVSSKTLGSLNELSDYLYTCKSSYPINIFFENKDLYKDEKSSQDIKMSISEIVHQHGLEVSLYKGLGFFHTQNPDLIEAYEYGYNLEKVLSWSVEDTTLFDFMIFLESTLISNLPSSVSNKTLLVIATSKDAINSKSIHKKQENTKLDEILQLLTMPYEEWTLNLDNYLQHPPCFTLFTLLVTQVELFKEMDIRAVVSSAIYQKIQEFREKQKMQNNVENFVSSWYKEEDLAETMRYKGVSLGEGLEYELIGELLGKLGAFKEMN